MAETITALVARRNPKSLDEYDLALREVIQEFMLLALWRAKFFEKAAFYGGTALRLLHGLDRFSEDLYFSLLKPDPSFRLEPLFEAMKAELGALGLDATLEGKKNDGSIQSAFLKTNTKNLLIQIRVSDRLTAFVPPNRLIKVKFEVEINPPQKFSTEAKLLLEPSPFGVRAYTTDCIFARKIHALLARTWQTRVKGRDWYDLVFLVRRNTPVNLEHLAQRLSVNIEPFTLTTEMAIRMLNEKIMTLDIGAAKMDMHGFIADERELEIWSREFFLEIVARIRFC